MEFVAFIVYYHSMSSTHRTTHIDLLHWIVVVKNGYIFHTIESIYSLNDFITAVKKSLLREIDSGLILMLPTGTNARLIMLRSRFLNIVKFIEKVHIRSLYQSLEQNNNNNNSTLIWALFKWRFTLWTPNI